MIIQKSAKFMDVFFREWFPIYGIVVHYMQSILTKHAKLEGLGVYPKKKFEN